MRITYGLDSTRVNYSASSVPRTYEIDLDGQNDTVIINSSTISANFDKTLPNRTLYVFANHDGNGSVGQYGSTYRLYYLKLYDLSGNLIRDYIPIIRTTDYKVGLLDKVSMTFYQNAGMGEFLPGIKVAGYSLLDYIYASGNTYFDTGVSGGSKMEYSIVLNTMGSSARNYEQYFSGDKDPVTHKLYLETPTSTKTVNAQQSGNNWSGTSSNNCILYTNSDAKQNINFFSDGTIYLENTLKGTGVNNGWGTLSYYVFSSHGESNLMSSMRLYYLVMKTDGDVVRFYVPMQRVSDSINGLYDIVNETFYPKTYGSNFSNGSVLLADDGTSSPSFSLIDVPSPSSYTGSIANQILRIKENIDNAYDVCSQIGRTMPQKMNSLNLEPTILDTARYTVTWKNYDNSTIETEEYFYGQTPVYTGTIPTKPSDNYYTYTFTSWSPNITTVTGNQTYTAQYSETINPSTPHLYKRYDNGTLYLRNNNPGGYTDVTWALYGDLTGWINHTGVTYYTFWTTQVETVNFENTIVPESCKGWFLDCSNLKYFVNMSNLDTSNCTNFMQMFSLGYVSGQTTFSNLDLTTFDISSAKSGIGSSASLSSIVNTRYLRELDLSTWDMSGFDSSQISHMFDSYSGGGNPQTGVTVYCRSNSDKNILENIATNGGYSWTFTVK